MFDDLKNRFNRYATKITAKTDPKRRIASKRYAHNPPEGSESSRPKDNEHIWYEARKIIGSPDYRLYAMTHFVDSGRTYKSPLDTERGRDRFSYEEALQFLKFIEERMDSLPSNHFTDEQPLAELHYSHHNVPDLKSINPLTKPPKP